jgi:hypothetical protein
VNEIIYVDRKGFDISFVTASESGKIRDAAGVFEVICESIDKLQSDSATFVDVISVLSNLQVTDASPNPRINERMRREVYAALVQHGAKLASDVACCIAFFHPGLDRVKYSARTVDAVRGFVRTSGALVVRVTPVDMVASFTAAMAEAPIGAGATFGDRSQSV